MHLYYNIATAFGLALESIRAHKLRSFLTLLGVIIGVASVILVGAAIDGLGSYAEGITAKAFGSNSYLLAQIAAVGGLTQKQLVEKQKRNKRIRESTQVGALDRPLCAGIGRTRPRRNCDSDGFRADVHRAILLNSHIRRLAPHRPS